VAGIPPEEANNLALEGHRKDIQGELGVAVDSLHSDAGSGRNAPLHVDHMGVDAVGNRDSDGACKHRGVQAPRHAPVSDTGPCP